MLDNFSYSTQEFYELLKTELKSHGVKEMNIGYKKFGEESLGIAKRRYLRVSWKNCEYYICAAPFGNGFFISWHLIYDDSPFKILIARIPFVGKRLAEGLFRITFYRADTTSMFMTYAQQSVLNVIEQVTNEKGVRKLSESEIKPIVHDFRKR